MQTSISNNTGCTNRQLSKKDLEYLVPIRTQYQHKRNTDEIKRGSKGHSQHEISTNEINSCSKGQGQHELSTDDIRSWSSTEQDNKNVNTDESNKCQQIKKMKVLPGDQKDCIEQSVKPGYPKEVVRNTTKYCDENIYEEIDYYLE